jgi:hypothetical protein
MLVKSGIFRISIQAIGMQTLTHAGNARQISLNLSLRIAQGDGFG